MSVLGWLLWWGVGNPEIATDDLETLLRKVGINLPAPRSIIPHDAFRRLTGDSSRTYTLRTGGDRVTLDLKPARSQQQLLVRHIVRTVKRGRVTIAADRVGDCVFYKPPKGEPKRARMRVTPHPGELPDREQIEQFCEDLKAEYGRALRFLDPQAVRRLVRNYLASVNALYIEGNYFLPKEEDAARLCGFLSQLDEGSYCHVVPVVNDAVRRALVSDALEAAISEGEAPDSLIATYAPLGVVPDYPRALAR